MGRKRIFAPTGQKLVHQKIGSARSAVGCGFLTARLLQICGTAATAHRVPLETSKTTYFWRYILWRPI
jgi:hypothetical protein